MTNRGNLDDVYNYWNNRPCNVRHSSKSQDSLEFFDEVLKKRMTAEPHITDFLCLERWKGKKILELGSGMGSDAVRFAMAGATVTCIDLTPNSLALCKRNFELRGLSGEFIVGNIEDLNSLLGSQRYNEFDLIYSFGVIHHTPNPKNVFQTIPNYLSQGGELRCMLYSRFSYKLFWLMNLHNNHSFSNADVLIQNYSEAQSGCPVTYTYTFDEVRDLIGDGLIIQNIWKDHIFMWDIESYKQNKFVLDIPFQDVSPEYLRMLKKELGWHTLFVATKRPLKIN